MNEKTPPEVPISDNKCSFHHKNQTTKHVCKGCLFKPDSVPVGAAVGGADVGHKVEGEQSRLQRTVPPGEQPQWLGVRGDTREDDSSTMKVIRHRVRVTS